MFKQLIMLCCHSSYIVYVHKLNESSVPGERFMSGGCKANIRRFCVTPFFCNCINGLFTPFVMLKTIVSTSL